MSLVEGEERATIPSMSWSSVVKGESSATPTESASEPVVESAPSSPEPAAPEPSVSFQMTSLGDDADPAPTPAPPAPSISFDMGTPSVDSPDLDATVPTPSPAPETSVVQPPAPQPAVDPVELNLSIPPAPAPAPAPAPTPAPAPPTPPVPAPTPPVVETAQPEPVELPPIVEATPSESVTQEVAALHAEPAVAQPTPATTPTPTPTPATTPAPVTTPAPTPEPVAAEPATHQPHQPDQTAALSLPRTGPAPAVPQANARTEALEAQGPPRAKKDRSTAVARIGFFLLFVAALVSAGVIFGRPYLFPAEWEDNALPFGEAVEAARGTEFAEPVTLIAQPNLAHRDLVNEQLLGDAQAEMATWRALGLAGPEATDDGSLRDLTSLQAPVLYSTNDGQVYYDQSFTQAHRDALIAQAMATAALDQDFAFSSNASQRGMDAEVATQAHVTQQATQIAELALPNTVAVPEPDVAPLAFLPPVLDYTVTAPIVLAEVLPPVNDVAANPLADLGTTGPTGTPDNSIVQMPSTSSVTGDVAVGDTQAMDRGFWYLVFASHLDAGTAYDMSNRLERAGLQNVQSADGRLCAVATLSTSTRSDNAALASALTTWTAAVAPELTATVSSLPDTSVQVRSCDPGAEFTTNARFGVARELTAWRAAEIAVITAVTAQGGDQSAIDQALAQLPATGSVSSLVALPAGTSPSDVASAARAAAADLTAS